MTNAFDLSGVSVTLSGAAPYYSSSNNNVNFIDFSPTTGMSECRLNSFTAISPPYSTYLFESSTGFSGNYMVYSAPGEYFNEAYTGLRLPPGKAIQLFTEPNEAHLITPGWLNDVGHRAVGSHLARYFCTAHNATALTTSTVVTNRLYLTPFITPEYRTIGGIAFNITTTGTLNSYSHAAIYRDDGNSRPGLLMWQGLTGTVGAAGVKSWNNLDIQMEPGLYWIGLGSSGTTPPVFRGFALASLSTNILGFDSTLGTAGAVGWFVTLTTASGAALPSYPAVSQLTAVPVPTLFLTFSK